MPEFQIDATSANRFISSLSKSLQALCHGCMDFDSGIEIVGYININIDSGSKVDYVLNEKVLKSTTNSMTFVSNSFLAMKDQPKKTRDGSCSPIPEIQPQPQIVSPYQHRFRGSYQGSHQRASMPFAHSLRGSQKRSWAGMDRDWRTPKKQRDSRQYPTHDPSSMPSPHSSPYPVSLTSAQNTSTANTSGSEAQSEINVKKEVFDNDNENTENDPSHSSADHEKQSNRLDINIKTDPDAATTSGDGETNDGTTDTDTDFKGTFLQPSNSEENPQADQSLSEQNNSQSGEDNQQPLKSNTEDSATDKNVVGDESSNNLEDSANLEEANVGPSGVEMPSEYDQAAEEANYPPSVYSDAGEGSSDAGQFEVIEIDDEDEDMQAMFGESRLNGKRRRRKNTPHKRRRLRAVPVFQDDPFHHLEIDDALQDGESAYDVAARDQSGGCSVDICSICRIALPIGLTFQHHFSEVHVSESSVIGTDPFLCEICQKGFITKERLRQHSFVHDPTVYSCFICDVKFKHKKNIKRHLESTHGLKKCGNCQAMFKKGPDFDIHLQQCVINENEGGMY